MTIVKPALTIFNDEQKVYLHAGTLQVLQQTGVRVDAADARALFRRAGCRIHDDHRVTFPGELVEWAIRAAPAAIDIYDRNGEPAFQLGNTGGHPTRFGIGVTNLYYQDPATDQLIPFARDHVAKAALLGQVLPAFDVVSTPGVLKSLPPLKGEALCLLEMMANTVKPLILLVSDHTAFRPVLDLAAHLGPTLPEKPFLLPYINPITPLVINRETSQKAMITIESGLPLIYSNYGMSGATAPITAAGTLAMLNAELLAGLTLSQLVRQGAPVVLGSLPAVFHMRHMEQTYTEQTMLLNLACAEMMAHYDLPHIGTSGSGPGWGPDLIAAGLLWMNHLTTCLGKVGMAPFVGGNLGSIVFSPASVVWSDDIIRQSLRFANGFSMDAAALGLEEIHHVGPGGDFLTAPSTLARCREESGGSGIWPLLSCSQWLEQGMPRAGARLKAHTAELLRHAAPPADHRAVLEQGEAFIHHLRDKHQKE